MYLENCILNISRINSLRIIIQDIRGVTSKDVTKQELVLNNEPKTSDTTLCIVDE